MASREPTKPHFISGSRKTDAQIAWEDSCKEARGKSKHEWSVSPSCTVPQDGGNGPTLHAGDKVDPDRIEGGMPTVIRWRRDGYIVETPERVWRTNAGEFEFATVKAFTHGGQIYAPGEGLNGPELDVPGTDGYQALDANTGKIVARQGRPPIVGTELAESLIIRGLIERRRLRDKVTAAVKRRLKREAEQGSKV